MSSGPQWAAEQRADEEFRAKERKGALIKKYINENMTDVEVFDFFADSDDMLHDIRERESMSLGAFRRLEDLRLNLVRIFNCVVKNEGK